MNEGARTSCGNPCIYTFVECFRSWVRIWVSRKSKPPTVLNRQMRSVNGLVNNYCELLWTRGVEQWTQRPHIFFQAAWSKSAPISFILIWGFFLFCLCDIRLFLCPTPIPNSYLEDYSDGWINDITSHGQVDCTNNCIVTTPFYPFQ